MNDESGNTIWHQGAEYKLSVQQLHGFLSKINKRGANECWPWTGSIRSSEKGGGYGKWSASFDKKQINLVASRCAWMLFKGKIPDGLHVLHNCLGGDNPACCNPAHLWLGTEDDNAKDRAGKGRHTRGERSGLAKLSNLQAATVKTRRSSGEALKTIASDFGISETQVSRIALGRSRQFDEPIPT